MTVCVISVNYKPNTMAKVFVALRSLFAEDFSFLRLLALCALHMVNRLPGAFLLEEVDAPSPPMQGLPEFEALGSTVVTSFSPFRLEGS